MIDENEFIEWFNSDSGFRMVPPKHYLCMIGKSEVEMCMDEFFKYLYQPNYKNGESKLNEHIKC